MNTRASLLFVAACLGLPPLLTAAPTASAPLSSSRALGLSSSAEASMESPLLNAQRLYEQGSWNRAAEAYEQACGPLPKIEKVPCRHWSVLALSQTGLPEDFWKATYRLDTLLSMTEPENPYFAELLLSRSRLHLMQGNTLQATRTWKMASAAASASLAVPLFQLCEDIALTDSTGTQAKECARIKPKDTGLLTTARAVTTPNPAFRSSSSSAIAISSSSNITPSSSSGAPATKQPTPATPAQSGWVLQLGAFGVQDNATLQLENLKKQKIRARIVEKAGKGRTLYIVQTEPFATRQEAQDYANKTLEPLKLKYQVLSFP